MQVNVNPNEDTEFHDALRAHGIIPQKPPSRSPSPELPTQAELREKALKQASVHDIDLELEDALGDEEEQILLRLREQRIAQLATESKQHRFGRVYPIGRPDYTREVTEASKQDSSGIIQDQDDHNPNDTESPQTGAGPVSDNAKKHKGTGVVCFLYKDSIETCRLLAGYLDNLAAKYPATKFVSIVGDKCIPNYPDRNLPTLLIYRNGELHRQIVGLRPEIGLDGMNTKCEDIELLLTAVGAIERSTVPGSSSYSNGDGVRAADSDEEEGRHRTIRSKTQEEEDDELDWDL